MELMVAQRWTVFGVDGFVGLADGHHRFALEGSYTFTVLVITILLQLPLLSKATLEEHNNRLKTSKNRPEHSSPPKSAPSNEATSQEPSDSAIFDAIVQSMQSYYARQATRSQQQDHSRRRRRRDEEVACYDDLGCFRDEGPFDYLDMLPLPPDRIQTRFLLQTRLSANLIGSPMIQMHYANVTSLYTGFFNRSNPTKMMIHGFGSSCQKAWATEMRAALLQADDVNVICVDWEAGAALPNYVQAAANTRLVGKQVARFILGLNALRGTNNTSFHLIGFSLGAHVAGFAGDELQNISRITGLDPAAPLFEGYSTKARLDPSDANFVDVIHSNGESLLYGGLGAFDTMGHVDYYPNGGKVQAGCSNIFVGAISDLIWFQSRSTDGRSLCNHRRAYKFFTDSVQPTCSFPAFACDDYDKFLRGECFECGPANHGCSQMGYHADKSSSRGKFYLLTREAEPFCANQFKVVVESSPGLTPTYGSLELTLISWNQVNETFQLSSESEQLMPGQPLSRVIVAHPSLKNLISAQIKYTPYKGWITNGLEHWAVDRLILVDSFQHKYSFCRRGLPLAEGKPTTVFLLNEDCTDYSEPSVHSVPVHPAKMPAKTMSMMTMKEELPPEPTSPNAALNTLPLHEDFTSLKKPLSVYLHKKRIPIIDEDKKIEYIKTTMSSSPLNKTNIEDLNTDSNTINTIHSLFAGPPFTDDNASSKMTATFRQKYVDVGPNMLSKAPNILSGRRHGRARPMQLPSGTTGIVRIISSPLPSSTSSNRMGRNSLQAEPDGPQLVFVPNRPVPRARYSQIHQLSQINHANGSRSLVIPMSSSRMIQGLPPFPPHHGTAIFLAPTGRRSSRTGSFNSLMPMLPSNRPPMPPSDPPPLPPPLPR